MLSPLLYELPSVCTHLARINRMSHLNPDSPEFLLRVTCRPLTSASTMAYLLES
jgi:hypothetical protein